MYEVIYFIIYLIYLILCIEAGGINKNFSIVGNPLMFAHPCKGNDDITLQYEPGRPPDEENQYLIFIGGTTFPPQSVFLLQFDSPATVILVKPEVARVSVDDAKKNLIRINFFKSDNHLRFRVKGPSTGTIPYLTSVNINTYENCEQPQIGILDKFILGYRDTAEIQLLAPDDTCGRRKVQHTGLIVNGQQTKPGDWPWHGAVYRTNKGSVKYVCGSTLISRNLVLTAAHCVTVRGAAVLPEIMKVVFGKYNLYVGDSDAQEKEVHEIIVHEEYKTKYLNNDIALLKLQTEVTFTNYVQPACLWNIEDQKKIPSLDVHGMVIGWGINENDTLSTEIKQADLPKRTESQCIKINPLFFSAVLNDKKFCAGAGNGTSPCNGDSGGGYHVFVPDLSGDVSPNATGTWHVRGIVSLSLSRPNSNLCDPSQYVVFTDVEKYLGWIKKHLN